MTTSHLAEKDLDALREISNVGVGNAANALSQMVGKTVMLQVPRVTSLRLQDVPEAIGGAREVVVGLYLRVYGDSRGNILVVFPAEDARDLFRLMMGQEPADLLSLTEAEESALREVGNILVSAYLNAVSSLMRMSLVPSVPGVAADMAGAVIDYLLIEISEQSDEALVVETQFEDKTGKLKGRFFLLPDPSSLSTFLDRAAGRS